MSAWTCVLCGVTVVTETRCYESPAGVEHVRAVVAPSWGAGQQTDGRCLRACRNCLRTAAGADLFARVVAAEVLRWALVGGDS